MSAAAAAAGAAAAYASMANATMRHGSANTTRRHERKQPRAAAFDVEALRRCLEENKGDRVKCQAHIDAFLSSCSLGPNTNSKTKSS